MKFPPELAVPKLIPFSMISFMHLELTREGAVEAATVDNLKKSVLKSVAIFTEKHLRWSLLLIMFSKFSNFIKKRLQRRCFPVNIVKILRTPILNDICERLLLEGYLKVTHSLPPLKSVFLVKSSWNLARMLKIADVSILSGLILVFICLLDKCS